MHFIQLTREFEIHLTIERAIRLRERELFDVMDLPNHAASLTEIFDDPERFARILWELVDQDGMTLQVFADMLAQHDGKKLWEMFVAELFSFFQEQTRSVVAAVVEAARNATLANQLPSNSESGSFKPGSPSTSLPESVESILQNYHSANSTVWPTDDSRLSGNEQQT